MATFLAPQASRLWFRRFRQWCGISEVLFESASCLVQITLGNNIVPIESGARFVTGNRHRFALRNTGSDQVPHSTASQIVK
jgi:hypothetical protein